MYTGMGGEKEISLMEIAVCTKYCYLTWTNSVEAEVAIGTIYSVFEVQHCLTIFKCGQNCTEST